MGYELNKLMTQYGLATPTMLSYDGERGPDVETINEETGEVTTTPGEITFDPAKQAAFDQYQKEYQFRLNNAPMYAGSQYRTRPAQQQPQTYEDMFTMYLGRPMGDGERNRFPSTTGLSDAQRNEFLRIYEPEFADLGINNTGNQLVMDQIGNYYGNILRNPDFNSNNNLPTPTNPVDPSAPFEERNPSAINPNPPYAGPVITTDDAYANAVNMTSDPYESEEVVNMYLDAYPDVKEHGERTALSMGLTPGTVEFTRIVENAAKTHWNEYGQEEGRGIPSLPDLGASIMTQASLNLAPAPTYETSDTFLNFIDQQNQNFANINNPVPITGYTLEEAYNIDPFALASNSLPSGFTYLTQNDDVMDLVNAQADAAGLAPSPERVAFMNNAAKDHFLYQLGQGEGRSWYKKGGSVKGFEQGGGDTTGLSELIIQQQVGGGPQTSAQAMGETSTAGIGGTNNNQQQTSNLDLQDTMINTMLAAAPTVENLYPQTMAASKAFSDAELSFNTTVEDIISTNKEGPDKAELYFKLAAAFAQPTKTKSFGFLENVPTVLADFAKDTRNARNKGQQMEITLAKSKLAQAKAKYDTLQNKRTTQGENYRKYIMDLYKIIAEKDKEAADRLLQRQKFEFEKKTLPPEIIKIKKADEEGLKDLTEGLSELRKGLKVNKNAGPSDTATMFDIRGREAVGTLTPEQRNTLVVMNIIGGVCGQTIKEYFRSAIVRW